MQRGIGRRAKGEHRQDAQARTISRHFGCEIESAADTFRQIETGLGRLMSHGCCVHSLSRLERFPFNQTEQTPDLVSTA